MADSALLKALMNQEYAYKPTDELTGALGLGVAQSLPSLVNPYGSTGANLASVLGGGLLAGLFGYSARKEAERKNAEMLPVMMDLMTARDTGAISNVLKTSPYGERLAPIGLQRMTALEEAKAQREAEALKREQGLSDYETKQSIADRYLRDRRSQYLKDQADADKNKPLGMSAALETQVNQSTGLINESFSIADEIEALSGTPELLAAKNMNAFGKGVRRKLKNLVSLVVKARSGTAASDLERINLDKVVAGDWSNLTPKSVADALRSFAKTESNYIADAMTTSRQKPEDVIKAFREAGTTGKPITYAIQTPTPTPTPTPTTAPPQRKDYPNAADFIAAVKAYRGN
jgi:hypothetical protein